VERGTAAEARSYGREVSMVPIWLAALVWLLAVFGTALLVGLCAVQGQAEAYREGYQDGKRAAVLERWSEQR